MVAAVARIEAIVAGSTVVPQVVNLGAGACTSGAPAINETVTGIRVQLSVRAIGSSALGQGGICVLRAAPDRRPAVGIVELNEASITTLSPIGLENVVVHEILHAMGIGTLWGLQGYTFVPFPLGSDPTYSGPASMSVASPF